MSAPRIAVVLGTYNRLASLQRAVKSIRLASPENGARIFAVDGGSVDGTCSWLDDQQDVVLVGQTGPLTGAVKAFNLGFGLAVDGGFPYICHFNDDAEFWDDGSLDAAVEILDDHHDVGEVAFPFDLRGGFQFEDVHGKLYANFGLVRRKAGMQVAVAQGDPTGRAWWNPIYRTYGADCEFGCWLWLLGWKVYPAEHLRVHDGNEMDELRLLNEAENSQRGDSLLFHRRWPSLRRPRDGSAPSDNEKIVFARTRHQYDSYTDFWSLVELSGFPTCYVDEMRLDEPVVYVTAPINGEHRPHLAAERQRVGAAKKATVIWWNLERPGKEFKADLDEIMTFSDRAWVSDCHYAGIDKRMEYVMLGSHPGLRDGPVCGRGEYDFCHMSHEYGRRYHLYNLLRARAMREGPNAWGLDRHMVLEASRLMLNVHQDEHLIGEPLRVALAAAYELPIVSETLAHAGGYDDLVLQADYDQLVLLVEEAADRGEMLADAGRKLHTRMCVTSPFRQCVERALHAELAA